MCEVIWFLNIAFRTYSTVLAIFDLLPPMFGLCSSTIRQAELIESCIFKRWLNNTHQKTEILHLENEKCPQRIVCVYQYTFFQLDLVINRPQ